MAEEDYDEEPEQEQEPENYDEPEEQNEEPPQEEEPEPEPEYKEPEQDAAPPQNYGDVDLPASVEDACNELYSDNPSFNWFSTKLVDPKVKNADLKIDKAGKGGLPELTQIMQTEKENIIFFLLRVNTYDDESSVRAKFVYGRYVGSKVAFMSKAKLTPNLGAIADQFKVKHLSKDCDEEMKDWNPEKLSKEFLRIGGAHKPSKYDYGGGAFYKV